MSTRTASLQEPRSGRIAQDVSRGSAVRPPVSLFGRARRKNRARRGHSDLRSGCAQLSGLRSGSGAHAAHSTGRGGDRVHRSGDDLYPRPADDSLFFVSPDDRGVSQRRRFLHCCAREHRRRRGAAGRIRADDRLRADGRGRDLRGRGRAGFRGRRACNRTRCCCASRSWWWSRS